MLYETYQSLSGSQKVSPNSHFGTVNTKISPQNISFQPPPNQHTHSIKMCLTVIAVLRGTQTGSCSFFQKKGMREIGMTNI